VWSVSCHRSQVHNHNQYIHHKNPTHIKKDLKKKKGKMEKEADLREWERSEKQEPEKIKNIKKNSITKITTTHQMDRARQTD
jgi:CRISPR/Cas system CSM-associated protein Csm4 (group 5 of RAMP superfamily)